MNKRASPEGEGESRVFPVFTQVRLPQSLLFTDAIPTNLLYLLALIVIC